MLWIYLKFQNEEWRMRQSLNMNSIWLLSSEIKKSSERSLGVQFGGHGGIWFRQELNFYIIAKPSPAGDGFDNSYSNFVSSN